MQQNQHCLYPPVFWTNSSSIISGSDCAPAGLCHIGNVPRQDACPPLPVPERRRPGGSSDGTCLCFLVVILLVLLALTGASLALFQIFRLQQELDMLRQLSSSGRVPPFPEMLRGLVNGTEEKKIKHRAHLTGVQPKGKANQKSLPLEWQSIYGHVFISGVRYTNRGLLIEEAGVYVVYAKVFFRGQVCTNQPLHHMVFKRNLAYPNVQVLMEDRLMNYCVPKHMWSRNSYLGAMFNLSRHDSVYVNVSDATLVNMEESKTFFGLYKL